MKRIAWLMAPLLSGLPLAAGADLFRESVPASPSGTLYVELDAGSLEVEAHDDESVEVEARATGWGTRSMSFQLTSEEGDARLVGTLSGFPLFGGVRVRVEVRVPEDYSLDLRTGGGSIEVDGVGGSIRARTSGGRIDLEETGGPVRVHTSGGSISAEDVDGDLRARTSGGRIRASEVNGEVDVETSGGSIQIDQVPGPVEARTSGGSVTVRFSDSPGGHIRTSGGSIEVEFPSQSGINLDARTSGGRVLVDGEILVQGTLDRGHVVGLINGGGDDLELRTSGGNVRVRER